MLEFPFEQLPLLVGHLTPMPAATVIFEDLELPITGLIDTGALLTICGTEIAVECGVDLNGVPAVWRGLGGTERELRIARIRHSLGGLEWEANVGFADIWPTTDHAVLGLDSFIRHFVVTIDVENELTTLTPRRR